MKGWLLVSGLLFSAVVRAELGPEKLMLIGGGPYPGKTAEIFCEWAGGENARLLLIHWAAEKPESRDGYISPFNKCVGLEEAAPKAPDVAENLNDLIDKIKRATAIFFTGGNQNLIMGVLRKHTELADLFRELYKKGIPFGGTSAGTAIMSATMITGDGPVMDKLQDLTVLDPAEAVVADGLGLLPIAVVDQHFLEKYRFARLLSVLLQRKEHLAVGVDEEAATTIEGGRRLTVVGGQAMAFHYDEDPKDGTYRVLLPGDQFDLVSRSRVAPP